MLHFRRMINPSTTNKEKKKTNTTTKNNAKPGNVTFWHITAVVTGFDAWTVKSMQTTTYHAQNLGTRAGSHYTFTRQTYSARYYSVHY